MVAMVSPTGPKTYSTDVPGRRGPPIPPTPLRLTATEELQLRSFFLEYESEIGWSSTYGAMAARLSGTSGGGGRADALEIMSEVVDRGHIKRGRQVFLILNRMISRGESKHVTVLYKLHGDVDPNARYDVFGNELAPLAELTPTVDAAVKELAAALGQQNVAKLMALEERARSPQRLSALEVPITELKDELDRVKAREGATTGDLLRVVFKLSAARRRVSAVKFMDECQDAALPVDAKRALKALARGKSTDVLADVVIVKEARPVVVAERWRRHHASVRKQAALEATTADALRWKLEYHGKRNPNGQPNPDAFKAWKAAKKEFVSDVKRDSERIRIAAANAFRTAKRDLATAETVRLRFGIDDAFTLRALDHGKSAVPRGLQEPVERALKALGVWQ